NSKRSERRSSGLGDKEYVVPDTVRASAGVLRFPISRIGFEARRSARVSRCWPMGFSRIALSERIERKRNGAISSVFAPPPVKTTTMLSLGRTAIRWPPRPTASKIGGLAVLIHQLYP